MTAATRQLLPDNNASLGRRGFGMILLVAMVAIGLYANSLPNRFAFDDCGIIEDNPAVQQHQWAEIWSQNYWPSTEGPLDILYRPLTVFTYVLNHAIAPNSYWPYHAVNVGLHAAISVMVAVLAWRLFRHRAVAGIAGLLFAAHPIHTEVVANVVGRAELLAAFWSLAGLLVFLPAEPVVGRSLLHNDRLRQRPWWHGLIVAACFLAAMLSKETPAALLLGFVFLDFWQWSQAATPRPTFWRWMRSRTLRYHLPLALAAVAYAGLRFHAVGLLMMKTRAVHPVVNPLVSATVAERIFTPFLLLAKYIMLMAWPKTLASDYSAPSLMPVGTPFHPFVLLGMLIVAAGVVVTVGYWRRHPAVAVTIVMLALSYALVANVIRIGTIFGERLFYWPSVFVCLLAGYGVVQVWRRLKVPEVRPLVRWASVGLACAGFVALSVRTVARNPVWHDNISLALATAIDNPRSAKACHWAGQVLVCCTDNPWTISVGEKLLLHAIELYPDIGQSHWELAKHYARSGRPDGLVHYGAEAALRSPGKLQIRQCLQTMDDQLQRYPAERYLPATEAWVKREPESPTAQFGWGLALRAVGRDAEAEAAFSRALELQPGFFEAGAELGMIKLRRGDALGAVRNLNYYVSVMQYNGEARFQLACALMQLDARKYPHALQDADRHLAVAWELLPGNPVVRQVRGDLAKRMAGKPLAATQQAQTIPATPAAQAAPQEEGPLTGQAAAMPPAALVHNGRP